MIAPGSRRGFTARLFDALEPLLGADHRSLATFRIGLGLLVLADLAMRSRDLEIFYTDRGAFPREVAVRYLTGWEWSLHFAGGSSGFQALLFALAALGALALCVGYRTRLATLLTWALTASLHNRNPFVIHGADDFLRLLLFWSLFAPLGARWSVDATRRAPTSLPPRALSVGTAALLLQMVLVHVFNGVTKDGLEWLDGTAVHYALHIDQYVTGIGRTLREVPDLGVLLTYAVRWFEIVAPLLLFVPVIVTPLRVLLLPAFVALHLGMGLCLELGLFPWVSTLSLLPFVPTPVWEWLSRRRAIPLTREAVAAPRWRSGLVGQIAAAVLWMYAFAWNLGTLKILEIPRPLRVVADVFGLRQHWSMFAPTPMRAGGWWLMLAKLENGQVVDLYPALRDLKSATAPRWEKPDLVSATIPNTRWLDYLDHLRDRTETDLRVNFSGYLCEAWNRMHGGDWRMAEIELVFMYVRTGPNGPAPPREYVPWRQECGRGRLTPDRVAPTMRPSSSEVPLGGRREAGRPGGVAHVREQ